MVYNPRYYFWS